MRSKTYYFLRRVKAQVVAAPIWLLHRWPVGLVALVGCGVYPLAGLGLALWFALLAVHTFLTPSGPTGNCAGAFGDMAVVVGGIVGAVLSLVAAGIGALFG